MALENLVDGMSGLQMANTIKNNFEKVLDAESAENKAENAGKSIKTDYDATRYIELQLADGTPVKMKMDVFCQAIAPVVAGNLPYVRNSYTNEKDFNNIKTAGFYPFGVSKEGYSNIPNVASLEGILVVIKSLSTSNYFQMYLGIQDGSLHFRSCYNNSWIGWLKVSA